MKCLNVRLSAQDILTPTTATLNLNISGTLTPYSMSDSMVTFVNGLFSPNYSGPQATAGPYVHFKVMLINRTTANSTAHFVLPGTSFGIVPVGFYLFSAYWALFTSIVAWGGWSKWKVHPL